MNSEIKIPPSPPFSKGGTNIDSPPFSKEGTIKVVAGIIANAKQEILVSLRPPHVPQGNLWEFPGGKLEAHENAYEALIRELKEEIGIQVITAKPFTQITHLYPERLVELDVWWIESFSGEPRSCEGQQVHWVSAQQLSTLNFPAANQKVVEALQLSLGK